jgi:hypothetical protein
MDPIGKSTGQYGGSIREAGGILGSMESAKEEMYFREQDKIKLQELREKMEADKHKESDKTEPHK